jgi:hypothetical protein
MPVSESSAMHQLRRGSAQTPQLDLKEMPPPLPCLHILETSFEEHGRSLPTRGRLFPYILSRAIADTLWSRILVGRAACSHPGSTVIHGEQRVVAPSDSAAAKDAA